MRAIAGDRLPSAVVRPLAVGALARVDRFRHAGVHRDPVEENVPRPTVVFTRRGTWTMRTAAGGGRLDTTRVALLDPAHPYQCRHDELTPRDHTLAVTFRRPLDALLEEHPALLPGHGLTTFPSWSVPTTPSLAAVARMLAALPATDRALRGLAADALGVQLLLAVSRALQPRREAARPDNDGPERVAAALRFIRAHVDGEVRLADIAAAAGVDAFRLLRLFRRELGSSPVRELRRLRLAHAARLLRDPSVSVTEACFASGHGSLSRFVSAFGREYGLPPGTWRRTQEAATAAAPGKTGRRRRA